MTVTITITDPTADESRAVRAYLDALHTTTSGGEWVAMSVQKAYRVETEVLNPTPEPPAEGPDFDSAGMPWDARIHAASKATVADGTWRKKRGVSPEEVAAVEAELADRTSYDSDVTPEAVQRVREAAAPALEGVDLEQIDPPPAPVPDHITADDMAEADANAADYPEADAPPPPPAAAPNPFLAVMSRIGKSKLDKAKKDELLTAAGALDEKGNPSILVLNKRPELIDGFVALLDSEGV